MPSPLWSRRAHRVLPRVLVAAGRREADQLELRFTPAWTERLFGRRPWSVAIDRVATVDVVPRDLAGLLRGGLVRRLRIVDVDGAEERFVIAPGLDRALEDVRAALDQPAPSRTTV